MEILDYALCIILYRDVVLDLHNLQCISNVNIISFCRPLARGRGARAWLHGLGGCRWEPISLRSTKCTKHPFVKAIIGLCQYT